MKFSITRSVRLSSMVALLTAGCAHPPAGPVVSPVTNIDTISPEAQQFYLHPPTTFVSIDSLPLMLRRMAINKYQDSFAAMQLKKYGGVTIQKSQIAGVPVLMVQPDKNRNPAQVLMNLHGGGFMLDAGSQTENIPIASLTGRTVVGVQYGLAPEHPYPAGINDAMAVYRKLLETHEAKNIIIYGTSAGATTTAQLAVRLKRDGLPMPAALGMFSMMSDFTRKGESAINLNPLIAGISDKAWNEGHDAYAPNLSDKDAADPMLSPLFADLSGLPPTLFLSGTRDLLLSQTILMHRAMVRAGGDARLVVFEGMPHAHWAYLDFPESKEAFEIQARFFEDHLGERVSVPSH